MYQPKKVAIIGAGPAGLVTAKTLLQNFPPGTFTPVIFEERNEIGGLWPSSRSASTNGQKTSNRESGSAGLVNPQMRTNLSRYTVSFSDLSWESVFDGRYEEVPMFPRAWQVGMYLEKYAERYIPPRVIRLGCKVVETIRLEDGRGWTVFWAVEAERTRQETKSEHFDYLVIASGFFSTPYIPDIPGLSAFSERTVHTSALDTPETINSILSESKTSSGKLLVIGGSMSGAEAASALALHLSSLKHTDSSSTKRLEGYEVHHVCTKPFWTLPTYLPQASLDEPTEDSRLSFLPLDIVLYNLNRRPPGPVEYSFGPLSTELISKMNANFRSILGKDYESCGHVQSNFTHVDKAIDDKPQPTFLAIGNDYAEFIRSKEIAPIIGRVTRINTSLSGSASVDITLPGNKTTTLNDVAAIILATGYKPNTSLSFLPPGVLSELEYDPNDSFLPLILNSKGTTNGNIPDLGFVGFYKGPYWGAMEMQARSLGQAWADAERASGTWFLEAEEREAVRNFRNKDKEHYRGQLPMADYVGFMESFARKLSITSAQPTNSSDRPGIVIPAKYTFHKALPGPGSASSVNGTAKQTEVEATLNSLQTTVNHRNNATSPGLAMAVFRALHGTWKFTRTYYDKTNSQPESNIHGTARFHPRYPSIKEYEKEYLYEETVYEAFQQAPKPAYPSRCIYSLLDPLPRTDGIHIHLWSCEDLNSDNRFSHGLKLSPAQARIQNGERVTGEYTIYANGSKRLDTDRGSPGGVQYKYVFNIKGVAITSWTCKAFHTDPASSESGEGLEVQTSYMR
ncbi:Pyridine nucleotide-disulfide oxidoreductase [Aspergillus sclerotialis]|uniref:Pyridine nucleotide-disulfide oxidoreductase n=1 Tax=Aspergillus sclerotialis TaxID=2070753 RepID=A0A3A2ZL39_9EURO|nr:Pyridine nucleotide-disulfide oxidoreductase [Aspergillus sclerotialis]